VLPLHDPLWTYVLLIVNAAVWLLMTLFGGSENIRVLVRFGAKVNPLIVTGEYWRFVTPMFLHIGFMHLALNGYALYIFGLDVERLFGRTRFLVLYLLSGIAGVVASFAGSQAVSAGAAGAIFGLIGSTLVYFAKYHENLGRFGRQRLTNLLVVTGLNLGWGWMAPGIDNLGHIGGLAAGLALGWAYLPQYRRVVSPFPWEPPAIQATYPAWRAWLGSLAVLMVMVVIAWWGIRHWQAVYATVPGVTL